MLATIAMGTRFEFVLAGDDPFRARAAGEAAIDEILRLDAQLSAFRRDSLLAHINRTAHARPVRLDDDLFALLCLIEEAHHASGGAFDPTVGPLMRAWGFRGSLPSDQAVEAARPRVGWRHVRLDHVHRTIAFTRGGIELDFGGVAKGFALDVVERTLREAGVTAGLVHGGTSSVLALGRPEAHQHTRVESGWRVGLRGRGATSAAGEIVLRDRSLSVSGPRGRSAVGGPADARTSHVLDPRTGAPALDAGIDAAWVVTEGAWAGTRAELWSTALLVDGFVPPGAPGVVSWGVERSTDAVCGGVDHVAGGVCVAGARWREGQHP